MTIVGAGWVGGNLGRGLESLNHDVVFYDVSEEKVRELNGKGFEATTDLCEAVDGSKAVFLCVPTPNEGGGIDLSYLKSAAEDLGPRLAGRGDFPVVTVKSTVVPGTTEGLVTPVLEEGSGGEAGVDFGVCMNPEFMTEISDSWIDDEQFERDFFSEDRIVIGELDSESGDVLVDLYGQLDVPVVRTDLKTAEMIKYACNCFLSTKISYWNEIFRICENLGIDSDLVASTAGMDPRIGKYGTVHGKAFGGKCLPKDLRAFIDFVEEEVGEEPELLKAVEDINKYMEEKFGVRE